MLRAALLAVILLLAGEVAAARWRVHVVNDKNMAKLCADGIVSENGLVCCPEE
jgi:hypothetical protein